MHGARHEWAKTKVGGSADLMNAGGSTDFSLLWGSRTG